MGSRVVVRILPVLERVDERFRRARVHELPKERQQGRLIGGVQVDPRVQVRHRNLKLCCTEGFLLDVGEHAIEPPKH